MFQSRNMLALHKQRTNWCLALTQSLSSPSSPFSLLSLLVRTTSLGNFQACTILIGTPRIWFYLPTARPFQVFWFYSISMEFLSICLDASDTFHSLSVLNSLLGRIERNAHWTPSWNLAINWLSCLPSSLRTSQVPQVHYVSSWTEWIQ